MLPDSSLSSFPLLREAGLQFRQTRSLLLLLLYLPPSLLVSFCLNQPERAVLVLVRTSFPAFFKQEMSSAQKQQLDVAYYLYHRCQDNLLLSSRFIRVRKSSACFSSPSLFSLHCLEINHDQKIKQSKPSFCYSERRPTWYLIPDLTAPTLCTNPTTKCATSTSII